MEKRERIEWIDAVKALAICLVVIGHAIEYYYTEDAFWHRAIYLFHMPLFFMISGMTYDLSVKGKKLQELSRITLCRVFDLFVPSFVFIVLTVIIRPNGDIFLYYNATWFLNFLIIILIEQYIIQWCQFHGKRTLKIILYIGMALGFVVFGALQIYFEIRGQVIYGKLTREVAKFFGYSYCFIIGKKLLQKHKRYRKSKIFPFFVVLSFFAADIILVFTNIGSNNAYIKMVIGIPISIAIILLYCRRNVTTRIEKVCALYSLEIYLIHSKIINNLWNPDLNVRGGGMLLVLMGIVIPIVIGLLENRITIIQFIFHPSKAVKRWQLRFRERE